MNVPAIDFDDARAFIAALTGSADSAVTFQTFTDPLPKPVPDPLARWFHGTLDQHKRQLVDLNNRGAGIFLMVNEGDGKGRSAENVVGVTAFFTDNDGTTPRTEALYPSFTVDSAHGPHTYWKMAPGVDLGAFTAVQKQLAAYYGTDPSVHDLPRVMRVPGFFHRKGEPYLVKFQPGSGRVYELGQILAAHPVAPPPPKDATVPKVNADAVRREKRIGIVRAAAAGRPWSESNRHASAKDTAVHARKLGLDDADTTAVVADFIVRAGKTAQEADAIVRWAFDNVEPDPKEQREPAKAPRVHMAEVLSGGEKADRESAAQVLIKIGEQNSFLFHDERESAHAAIGPDDARRIVSVKSDVFTKFLCGRFYRQTGKGANGEAVATARNVLASKALFEGPRHTLHNRFAWHEGALWIDLADSARRAARVTERGWTIEQPPILFRSFKRQAPLPEPREGGDLRDLLKFVNVQSDEDSALLLTWTALAPLGDVPRPILDLHGAQGAGKTTVAKMLRRITDPSAAGTNHFSNKDEELALAFETNAVPYFDNLVHISGRQAELMCQAVTGGGFSKRELFTDSDEILYDFRRAILVTGINVPSISPDLLDRFLMIQLDRVTREARQTESALWRAFDAAAPGLFGGILDALAGAMVRHPRIVNEAHELERMADWTLWGLALAESIGSTPAAFLAAYQKNVGKQTEEVLEADPVARAVRDLASRGGFEGTPSDLLKLLRERAGDEAKTEGWPKRADNLSRRLNILRSSLADAGVSIRSGRGSTVDRVRTVTIAPMTPRITPGTASDASNASNKTPGLFPLDALDALDAELAHTATSSAPDEAVA